MTRALLPVLLSISLTACGGALPDGFEADLTETCAANYIGGGGDLSLYAADAHATVSMWVSLEGVLAGLGADEGLERDLVAGEGLSVAVTTGRNLREICSDVAINEVQRGRYTLAEGAAAVVLEPYDDNGTPTWLATVTLTDLVLEPDDGGEAVEVPEFVFDAVEVWER